MCTFHDNSNLSVSRDVPWDKGGTDCKAPCKAAKNPKLAAFDGSLFALTSFVPKQGQL